MKKTTRLARLFGVLLFWLTVWFLGALALGKPLLLPSPLTVAKTLIALMGTAEFYIVTAKSLWNVLSGILWALLLGVLLAFLSHRFSTVRTLILPLMSVVKATPVASFIVLALIWIGSEKVPAFITLLIVLPVLWTNLDEGLCAVDPKLDEVTRAFRMSPVKRLRVLILPTLRPYFSAALRTSVGLSWKAGIAAEIIAMPKNSIGTMIGDAKQYIQTAEMFAWTLAVVLLSLLLEYGVARLFATGKERKTA